MNLINEFKGKKKAIQCKTEEEFERIKKIFEGLGLNCKGIVNYYKGFTRFIIDEEGVLYSVKDFCKHEGFEIIDSTEIQEETPKIKVIKAESEEHGKKIIKYLETIVGKKSPYKGYAGDYYGINNSNYIDVWSKYCVLNNDKFEIIELPEEEEKELPIPRNVLVRDNDGYEWNERLLVADFSFDPQILNPYITRRADDILLLCWRQMKELPQPTELSKEEAENKLKDLTGEQYKII